MRNSSHCNKGIVCVVFAVTAAGLLLAGCGGDSAKPKPVLNAMGVVLVDETHPAGGPYQVAVVVSVDGQAVSDAEVSVNGIPLVYNPDPQRPDQNGFVGLVPLQTGQAATLLVRCEAGERTQQAITPGPTQILTPSPGAHFDDAQDIAVTWTPAANTTLCIVACGGASMDMAGTWMLPKTADRYSVPAAYTAAPGNRISVVSLNGSGAFPTPDLRDWVGEDGFWVSSQDWVDVQVGGQ